MKERPVKRSPKKVLPLTAADMARLRWKNVTKKQRSTIARKAARARWRKIA